MLYIYEHWVIELVSKSINSCKRQAADIVTRWFENESVQHSRKNLKFHWFAWSPYKKGFQCMVRSTTYENLYFEVIVNFKTGEESCTAFVRTQHFVGFKDPLPDFVISEEEE